MKICFIWLISLIIILGCSAQYQKKVAGQFSDYCKTISKTECDNCVDGYNQIVYYDSNYYNDTVNDTGSFQVSRPEVEESIDHFVAIHSTSICKPCYNNFELSEDGSLKKVSCEEFLQAIQSKNESCNGCIRIITAGCC